MARWIAFGCVLAGLALCQTERTPELTVCELLKDPGRYNHKMVALRGLYITTMEGAWLAGAGCDGVLVSAGFAWPTAIWISGPNSLENSRKFWSRVDALDPRHNRVTVTMTGLFETYDDLASRVRNTRYGLRGFGFGHEGSAPGHLDAQYVDPEGALVEPLKEAPAK